MWANVVHQIATQNLSFPIEVRNPFNYYKLIPRVLSIIPRSPPGDGFPYSPKGPLMEKSLHVRQESNISISMTPTPVTDVSPHGTLVPPPYK